MVACRFCPADAMGEPAVSPALARGGRPLARALPVSDRFFEFPSGGSILFGGKWMAWDGISVPLRMYASTRESVGGSWLGPPHTTSTTQE